MTASDILSPASNAVTLRTTARAMIAGGLYCAAALFSLVLASTTDNLAAIWFASPILLAALLREPRPLWPAFIFTCMAGSVIADVTLGAGAGYALMLGMSESIGIVCAALLLTRAPKPVTRITGFNDMLRFTAFGLVAGPALGAALGGAVISASDWTAYPGTVLRWFASSGIGMLVLAPLLLSWNGARFSRDLSRPARIVEGSAYLVATVACGLLIFRYFELPTLFLISPVLVWGAIRFRVPGVAMAVLLLSWETVASTMIADTGPIAFFSRPAQFGQIQLTQIYLALVAIPMFLLASILNDQDRTRRIMVESERRFRDLAELAGDWFWETDEHHRFLELSLRFSSATAFAPKDFIGRTRWEMAGGGREDPGWRDHVADLESRRPFRAFEYSVTMPDGRIRHFVISGNPSFHRDGRFRGYIGAGQEITGAVERDAALRESERRLKDYASVSSDFFWRMDDGLRFTWFSDRFTDVTGVKVEELLGKTREEAFIPGVDAEVWRRHLDDLAGRRPFRGFVHPRTLRNGRKVWLSISGMPIFDDQGRFKGYRGTGSDITDLVESEEALSISTRVLEASTSGIVVAENTGGEHKPIIYVNPAFERMSGYKSEDILGRPCDFHIASDLEQPELTKLVNAIEGRRPVSVNLRSYRKDGSLFWNQVHVTPVFDSSERCTHFVGIQNDVSEQVGVEEALRQAQKMEAVGQLTGGLAHDFNNLLTVMLGNLRLVSRRVGDDPRLSSQVEAAERAARRGADLTRRLLAFSRRQVLNPEIIDTGALVEGMGDLLGRTLGESVEIRIRRGAELWPARVDSGQLESALLNLAINARDALEGHGVLEIAIENAVHAAEPEGSGIGNQSEYVCISVRDTGCGMSDEVREHAMEPFFTTKEASKGSGLGLSMVYGFVNQSGGQVEIDSVPGRGTEVRLYLPRAAQGLEPARAGAAAEEKDLRGSSAASGTVLVVEDDDAVRDTAIAALEELGYRVLDAPDGPSAAALINRRDDIDLLFTDVIMPGGMNGVELAKTARRRRPDLRVLFTTGYARNAFPGAELEPGAELLSKPYLADELAHKLETLLADRPVA